MPELSVRDCLIRIRDITEQRSQILQGSIGRIRDLAIHALDILETDVLETEPDPPIRPAQVRPAQDQKIVVEASDINLSPGCWPDELTYGGRRWHAVHRVFDGEDELAAVVYIDRSTGHELLVLND